MDLAHFRLCDCTRNVPVGLGEQASPAARLPSMIDAALLARPALVRRGIRLNYLTLAYNTVEAIVSIAAGLVAGSVALVGFGVDSGIEVTASVAAQWRL